MVAIASDYAATLTEDDCGTTLRPPRRPCFGTGRTLRYVQPMPLQTGKVQEHAALFV